MQGVVFRPEHHINKLYNHTTLDGINLASNTKVRKLGVSSDLEMYFNFHNKLVIWTEFFCLCNLCVFIKNLLSWNHLHRLTQTPLWCMSKISGTWNLQIVSNKKELITLDLTGCFLQEGFVLPSTALIEHNRIPLFQSPFLFLQPPNHTHLLLCSGTAARPLYNLIL